MIELQLIKEIAQKSNLSQKQAEVFIKGFNQVIIESLIQGEKINLPSFGMFKLKTRSPKNIKHPKTQTIYNLPQRKAPVFVPSRIAKKNLKTKYLSRNPQPQPTTLTPNITPKTIAQSTLPEKPQITKLSPASFQPRRSLLDTLFGRNKPGIQTKPISVTSTNSQNPDPPAPPKTKSEPKIPLEAKIPEDIKSAQKEIEKALTRPAFTKSTIKYLDLKDKTIPKEILSRIPEYIARLYQAVPIEEKDKKLVVAMVDPEDYQAIEFIKKKIGSEIKPVLATQADIAHILEQYSGLQAEIEKAITGTEFTKAKPKEELEKGESIKSEAPTSRAVQSIVRRAVVAKASDIHIEPTEKEVIIRYRIDGILRRIITLPKSIQASIVSRIKILSNMKIDEARVPQDGRFGLIIDKRQIDFRVSTFPAVYGEKVVMRILDKSAGIISLEELGVRGNAFDILEDGIHKAHGMTLVTGPTGSGKTTTLYAVLDRLNKVGVNIITLEDPVEYQIAGINQGQVRADIGFSFAKGLRSILRQDPDIIMVGEIRDLETAEMAVHAALTGHVVLSTLHTNDAAGAVPRLIDMGVEPFLVTSSVNTVIAQRLGRKICDKCKIKTQITPHAEQLVRQEIAKMPEKERQGAEKRKLEFFKGKGCDVCSNSGYKKRIGIFEIFPVTPEMQALIIQKVPASKLAEESVKQGMLTMKQDGILKVLDGITTLEEVWRVTKE